MFKFNAPRFIFLGIIVAISVVLFGVYVSSRNIAAPVESQVRSVTSTPDNPFNPAQYGVPDTLGGYKVLAIMTAQDVPCMSPPEGKNILLQATENTVREYLKDSRSLADILTYLHELPGEANTMWHISMVGPGLTLESLKTNTASFQASMLGKPCHRLAGPIDENGLKQ